MIDEKLDERIQKFATARVRDSDFGVQPTQSLADTQGEAPPVAQNVPTPTRPALPSVQTRTDTSLPNVRAGSVYRDASGLHTGQYVTQKDFEEGQAQVEAYKRAHPERTGYRPRVTSNRYRGDSWNRPPNTSAPSATVSRQGAAQFRQAAQQSAQAPAAQGGGIDLAATNARAKAMRQQAADQEAQGREKMDGLMGQALTTLLGEWRQNAATEAMADPMNGKQTWAFRVARLEPATLRQINEQRQSFGLRDTDKVIGMMAVGDAGADGKTGTPSFYLRYRDANGRVHTRVATYEQAARQYAMAHMKANGSTDAAYDLANNETWNDPLRYKNTGAYLATQAKMDAANLKNQQTQQQMEQARIDKPYADAMTRVDSMRKQAATMMQHAPDEAAKLLKQANETEKAANFKRLTDMTPEGKTPILQNGQPMTGWVKQDGVLVKVKPVAQTGAKPKKPGVKPQAAATLPQGENLAVPAADNTPSVQEKRGTESSTKERVDAYRKKKDEQTEEMQRRYTDVFDEVRKRAEEGAKRSVELNKKVGANGGITYDDAYREIFARLAKDKIERLSPQELEHLEKVQPGELASKRINLRQSIFDLYGIDIYGETGLVGGLTGNGGTSNRMWYEDLVNGDGTIKKGSWRRGGKSSGDWESAISVGKPRARRIGQ